MTNAAVVGVGEGLEEVSEEALADAIKGIADLAKWTNGSLLNMDDWFDRYAMNFVGGLIGGGVNGATLDFSTITKTAKLTPQEATKQVIHMINNGETEQLFKAIDKTTWAPKNLSAINFVRDEKTGQILYAQGTEEENQNLAVKTQLKNQLNLLIDVLEANGARISDESIFDANTLRESRFRALADTSTAARYSEIYAQKISEIANLAIQEQQLVNTVPDSKEHSDKKSNTEEQVKKLQEKREQLVKDLEDMQEGKYAVEFIGAALLEMHPAIAQAFFSGPTLDLFVQRNDKEHRHYKDLSEAEKAEYQERYENYKKTDKKDEALQAYETWKTLMKVSKSTFAPRIKEYAQKTKDFSNILNNLYSRLNTLTNSKSGFFALGTTTIEGGFLASAEGFTQLLAAFNNDPVFVEQLNNITQQGKQQLQDIDTDETLTEEQKIAAKDAANKDSNFKIYGLQLEYLINNYGSLADSIVKTGYLNPVVKQALINAKNQIINVQNTLLAYAHENLGIVMAEEDSDFINNLGQIGLNVSDTIEWADSLTGGEEISAAYQEARDAEENDEKREQITVDTLDVDVSAFPIPKLLSQIDKALAIDNSSPILNLLDAFALDVTGKQTNFSGMFANVNTLIDLARGTQGLSLSNVELDEVIPQIDEALKLTELVHSLILGARSDTGGVVVNENYETGKQEATLNFGINSIINEIKSKTGDSDPLYTIDGQTADNIIDDLHLLAKNLQFWKDLYGINSGQKLSRQPKINLNQLQLIHKALRKLYDVAPDDIDKSMLSRFFEESNPLEANKNAKSVDDSVLENLEKERIALEDALYKFGKVNDGKNFLNIEKLTSIFQDKGLILNESTEEIDQNTLAWYIASRMALKSSEFYNAFKQVINDDIAPLSIQELGVYLQSANALNGDRLTQVAQQIRQSQLDYITSLSQEERFNLIKQVRPNLSEGDAKLLSLDVMIPYLQNLGFVQNYDNITFLEGIAGSGKTRAVMKMTSEVINLIKPELLDDAFVVDTSEKNAHNLGSEGLQLKKYKAFDKESLLKYISNWVKPIEKNGIFQYVEGKDYIVTSDGKIQAAYKLKTDTTPPKLIIIDEIGRYTDLEIQAIDEYAKTNGVSVLAFGDLDQTRSKGDLTVKIEGLEEAAKKAGLEIKNGDSINFTTSIERNSFIHGPKLGVSMRTRNAQQDKNQALMQVKLNDPQGDILFSYFEGENKEGKYVLNGARVFDYPGTQDSTAINQVIELVKKLAPTLEEGEKIGVISPTADRHLWSELKSKFGDIFEFYEGNSAQGREARYFIMDMDINEPEGRTLMEELNTGITRAQDGIIILTNQSVVGDNKHNKISRVGNLPMDSAQREIKLPKQDIIDFSRKRKAMFNRIIGDSGVLPEYIARKPKTAAENEDTPKFVVKSTNFDQDTGIFTVELEPYDLTDSSWMRGSRPGHILTHITSDIKGENVKLFFDGVEDYTPYPGLLSDFIDVLTPEPSIINPVEAGTPEVKEEETRTNLTPQVKPKVVAPTPITPVTKNQRKAHIERVKNDPMPLLFYTNASLETGGYERGSDGKAVPVGELDSRRIDSMNGLFNVLGLQLTYDEALDHLMALHKILIGSTDRSDLNTKIQKYFTEKLGISGKTAIQFGIWSSSRTNSSLNDENGFGAYERNENEKSLFNDIDEDKNINNQNLAAIISVDGKNSLMLPIAYISSPFTIGTTMDGTNPVYPEVFDIIQRNGATNEAVETILRDSTIKEKYPALWNRFKLFHFTHNGFFPIEDPNFNPNSSFNNYGIQIDKNKGSKQINGDYQLHTTLTKEFVPISEFQKDKRMNTSREAYMFSTKQIIAPDNSIRDVLPGRPFVLVSTKEFINDEAMLVAALDPNDNSTRLVYLLPPTMTFQEYADGLMNFDQTGQGFVGNDTTAFHILNAILNTDESFLKDNLTHDGGLLTPSEFAAFKTVLGELNDLFKNKQYNDFLSKLKSDHNGFLMAQGNIEQKLAKIIRAITYPKAFDINTGKLKNIRSESNINEISKILENGKFEIYDTVRYNNEATPMLGIAIPIKHDAGDNFKINGRELQMDARVTTPTFGTKDNSFNLFIDKIVNEWILNDSWVNADTGNTKVSGTLHRAFTGIKPKKAFKPSILFKEAKTIADKLNSLIYNIDYNNPIDDDTEFDEFTKILKQINQNPKVPYIVLDIDGKLRLIDYSINDGLVGPGAKNVNHVIISDNPITINGKQFSIELSSDKTRLILTELNSNTVSLDTTINISSTQVKQIPKPLQKAFANVHALLSSGRADITLQELMDAAELDGKLDKLDKFITDDALKEAIKDKTKCNTITINI